MVTTTMSKNYESVRFIPAGERISSHVPRSKSASRLPATGPRSGFERVPEKLNKSLSPDKVTRECVRKKPPKTLVQYMQGSLRLFKCNENSYWLREFKELNISLEKRDEMRHPMNKENNFALPANSLRRSKSFVSFSEPLETYITIDKEEKTRVHARNTVGDNTQNATTTKNTISLLEKVKKNFAEKKKSSEEMKSDVVKMRCTCSSCDKFLECPAWRNNNIMFPKLTDARRGLPLLKISLADRKVPVKTHFKSKVFIHGPLIPKPVFSLDDTFIDPDIQSALRNMNCTSAKDIQSYMWPAVQRGLNVFMVGPSQSGKTFAYLPMFCTFSIESKERHLDLSKYEGPLIVILCTDDEKCEELLNIVKTLAVGFPGFMVDILTSEYNVQRNCDIVISTPSALEHHMKMGELSLKRLCHLAIENAHVVLQNHNHSIAKLIKVIDALQSNRPYLKNIQMVLCSEKWSVDLEILLKKLNTSPIIIFDDFLEAAVYSGIQFQPKRLNPLHKIYFVNDVLKANYMTQKSVVFCPEDEIPKIRENLEVSGVECIAISRNISEEEIFENEEMWNSLTAGHYKVLLCTDEVFDTMTISNAHRLIHYDLPTNGVQLQKRFRCLANNFRSPLPTEDEDLRIHQLSCFVIIDSMSDNPLLYEINSRRVPHLCL